MCFVWKTSGELSFPSAAVSRKGDDGAKKAPLQEAGDEQH